MLKEIQTEEYAKYYKGKIGLFDESLYLTKTDFANPSTELKALLSNKDMEFISVSLLNNKGKVEINEEAFVKLFNFLSYNDIEKLLNEFIDDMTVWINRIYKYNIVNRNFFWSEISNITDKVNLVFILSKDNRSLFYRWNSLTKKEQQEFIEKTAEYYDLNGVFNAKTGYLHFNKITKINELRSYPEIIIYDLIDSKILINESDAIQKDILVEISNKIIEKML
jgi:hypothetical protein